MLISQCMFFVDRGSEAAFIVSKQIERLDGFSVNAQEIK